MISKNNIWPAPPELVVSSSVEFVLLEEEEVALLSTAGLGLGVGLLPESATAGDWDESTPQLIGMNGPPLNTHGST